MAHTLTFACFYSRCSFFYIVLRYIAQVRIGVGIDSGLKNDLMHIDEYQLFLLLTFAFLTKGGRVKEKKKGRFVGMNLIV